MPVATVPVSPVVTTVPVTLGKVIVLGCVGSATVSVVSLLLLVAPSNTMSASSPKLKLPIIDPPRLLINLWFTSCVTNKFCVKLSFRSSDLIADPA